MGNSGTTRDLTAQWSIGGKTNRLLVAREWRGGRLNGIAGHAGGAKCQFMPWVSQACNGNVDDLISVAIGLIDGKIALKSLRCWLISPK